MFRIFCLLFLAIAPAALRAAIINVPAAQPTIQAGINSAANGDTVLVAPGTYYENIDFKGKAITVTSSGGAANTIIDGRATRGVGTVNFVSGELHTSIISNFTIQNGGLDSPPAQASGGVYIESSAPTVLNNIITSNTCSGVTILGRGALVQGNTISNTLNNNSFNCPAQGTGILVEGDTNVGALTHSDVIGNIIENNTQGLCAGGIWVASSEGAVIQGNIIRNNVSRGCAGGITTQGTNAVSILQNLIYGNTGAQSESAGGISISSPSPAPASSVGIVAGNTIIQNSDLIAPLRESATELNLSGDVSQYVVVNNILVGSSSSIPAMNCSVVYNSLNITPPVFDHNDIYNSNAQGQAYGGACPNLTGSFGNISADPRFNNSASFDFHLLLSSPAIDAGNNSAPQMPVTDLDGNRRIQDATGKGFPNVDMGAYEFPGVQELAPTIATLVPSSYTPAVCSDLILTASVGSPLGVPSGPVNLFVDLNPSPYAVLNLDATGHVNFDVHLTTTGVHSFYITYSGTPPFTPAISVNFYVNAASGTCGYPTTITFTSSANPASIGQPITFAVKVSSNTGVPGGTVPVTDGISGPLLATLTLDPAGQASFTNNSMSAGVHTVIATFAGTTLYAPSNTSLTQTIIGAPTTTLLAPANPNPASALQPVTLTAAVSTGTATIATGTITFFDGTITLGTATLDATGHATYITSTLTTGIHTINAVYSGNTSFAISTSNNITETITANPTFTTLGISPTQSQAFQFFTVTVSVSSLTSVPFSTQSCSPACTATLTITGLPSNQNSTVTAPVLGNGTATFRYALAVGTYTFTAAFNGSSAFTASTSGILSETVVPATTTLTLTATPTTANQSQSVAFTSVLTAPLSTEIPSGTITLLDGATPFATAPFTANPLSNTATITAATTTLSVGTHIITATYPGNPNFLPIASAPITVIINANDFTLATSTPNPTIPTEHHLTIPINLSSIGVFSDQVTLACGTLPAWTTCTFDQNTLPLTADGTATINLTIDTSSVYRYAHNQSPITAKSIAFALTLPAGIFGLFLTRRRKLPLRLVLFFLTTLAATLTLTGCTGMYPLSTPPGTYTLNITAHGTTTGLSHTLAITLTITP